MFKLDDIEFMNFSFSVNTSVPFYNLQFPGVFCVYCVKTNRVFFWTAECSTLDAISCFFENLVKGSIKNKKLLDDFNFYGKEGFQFFILDCNFDFENSINQEEALDFYKNLYSGEVY